MTDYTAFSEVIETLPSPQSGSTRKDLPAFRVVVDATAFVEPVLTTFDTTDNPKITFISARGATGKSAMAAELSRTLRAPLWSLGEDKAVSGDALTARLAAYLGVIDPPNQAPQACPLLIIDAMDEARLRVTGVSWAEFLASLAQYAAAGIHLVVLGRQRTIEDVWSSLGDTILAIDWYEISHFTPDQQSDYVDLRALGDGGSANAAYANAKAVVLGALNSAEHSSLGEAFAGYAPVLDAVARLLRPGQNYQIVANDFQGSAVGGNRLKVLRRILDTLLLREQAKIEPLALQLGVEPREAYAPDEQVRWLASELLGGGEPTLEWCPPMKRAEYADRVSEFLDDHPFRDGDKWASPVFSGFVAYQALDVADPVALAMAGSASGLLFEFASADVSNPILDVEEQQFAALHGSLLAGQWASSTSVVSLRGGEPGPDGAVLDRVNAVLTLSQSDALDTSLTATVLLSSPGRLQLISPLANMDVEFGGGVTVTTRGASLDLGPDLFVRAESIELAGSSIQISKDTSSTDVSGPAVELEVSNAFQSDATLIGSVSINDFSIISPTAVKLNFPWVQYRTEPEGEVVSGSPDDRARRLLNKLMSLARRHGHSGLRAVYIKKLEGRQGLESEDFQRAISVLISKGVADLRGELLFINDEWDRHRYDGKGRPGMTSYEDKQAYWQPILVDISEVLT